MKPKEVRNQIRNIIKEEDFLTAEILALIESRVSKKVEERLNRIDAHLRSQLETIDQRSKDMQSYIVRNVGSK